MRISATGKAEIIPCSRGNGFTLIELLIVMTIIGLVSAAVVLAMPDPRGSLLTEAERFAARAHAAQERAIMDGRPTAIRLTSAGYGFDERKHGEWKPMMREPFVDHAWGEGTEAQIGQTAQRLVFDSTGAAAPTQVALVRGDERVRIEIGADGKARVAH